MGLRRRTLADHRRFLGDGAWELVGLSLAPETLERVERTGGRPGFATREFEAYVVCRLTLPLLEAATCSMSGRWSPRRQQATQGDCGVFDR